MKKLLSLILAIVLILSTATALAGKKEINGKEKRNVKVKEAGLNPSADEMIDQGISPTTGRTLDKIKVPDGYLGTAVTYKYQPIMVMISNAGGGMNKNSKGEPATAPINAKYADVVYEACQAQSKGKGTLTRFTMVFSDVVPNYVGFVRSTRLTHPRIRQEWNCAFCTSGYSNADVPTEWKRLKVKNPQGATPNDPGLVYEGGYPKVWHKYVRRLYPAGDANSEIFELANIVKNIIPKNHVPANHTYKFTDTLPEGGDSGEIIYVSYGGGEKTDSQLEYDEKTKAYIRYVPMNNGKVEAFREQVLVKPYIRKVAGKDPMIDAEKKKFGDALSFSNVIIQSVEISFKKGGERPDAKLIGSGNADYFMGGKHYKGVWKRKDYDSRTVFYGMDGKEIEMLRGKTLIILMDFNNKRSVNYE